MANSLPITPLLTPGEIAKELGRRVAFERRRRKISRTHMAALTGVSVPTIGRFERDGVTTTVNFIKLLQVLHATSDLDVLLRKQSYTTLDEFLKAEDQRR
jgi:transcriptional regulator with XRE-family HTH domain